MVRGHAGEIEHVLIVSTLGTTGLEQTFEHLAQRQRDILGDLQTVLARLPAPPLS